MHQGRLSRVGLSRAVPTFDMTYHYTASPTDAQLEKAADLVDAGGQLAAKLDRKKFRRSSVVVVALDENEVVVGAAAVKERKAKAAEIGYLIVHKDHRKLGSAQDLTQHRIAAAKEKGLALLFANVRRDNIPSIGNLRKAKFEHWGTSSARMARSGPSPGTICP